ncbi:MAG: D-glycero-beta-D-manno-heptose 1-phosphate adenylyltransferase [Chloroflexi bacterium]|nr:D-glycero-beta-D-manno-heptose 1-phosphate adenylyltransferase [Chloroflexota bacterium]
MPATVLPRKELLRSSEELRSRGLRLVLTNGCFDLLHVGHVRYLARARALGDALAIGLNSDASVRRLKGPGRPLTPQAERAEVLAALEAVDFVSIFDEDTAEELVRNLRPAVYVKGGDYSPDPASSRFPPEGRIVREYGGTVAIVDYLDGYSTSSIVERLNPS